MRPTLGADRRSPRTAITTLSDHSMVSRQTRTLPLNHAKELTCIDYPSTGRLSGPAF
jgi:hypothetical protein